MTGYTPKGLAANCENCEFYDYDDYTEEYYCTAKLDQDDAALFLSHRTASCPYYRYYDEYRSVRKQI